MIRFFKLTCRNLIRGLGICFLIFCGLVFILMVVVALVKNDAENFLNVEAVYGGVTFSSCISIFIMVLAFFTEYYEFYQQERVFKRIPFSQMDQLGFERHQLFRGSTWKLYKEVYHASINGYHVVADLNGKRNLWFTFLIIRGHNLELTIIPNQREIEISINDAGVVVSIPVDSYYTPGIQALGELLRDVSARLIQSRFQPAPDITVYENKIKWDSIMRGFGTGA